MSDMQTSTIVLKRFSSRKQLGAQAAADVSNRVRQRLEQQEFINMLFAAAPSQIEFLESFCRATDIDFARINAFHMDEYIGLPQAAPQRFGCFLKRHLFSKVGFRSVHYLNGNAGDIDAECKRYEALLQKFPMDIICLGIGENGHIAFNDPAEADFEDARTVKMVRLDEVCRAQQVNDGCFERLAEVPTSALTLTIPALANAAYHFCIVPGEKKAQAVRDTLYGEIREACPATILRRCKNITFYVDSDSARLL